MSHTTRNFVVALCILGGILAMVLGYIYAPETTQDTEDDERPRRPAERPATTVPAAVSSQTTPPGATP